MTRMEVMVYGVDVMKCNNNNINKRRWPEWVRKLEIQQQGTNTAARTVEETRNFS